MAKYNFRAIEKKWQRIWDASGIYRAKDFSKKEKFYCMIEFPYPSGAGLHVGHIRSHTAMDIVCRKRRMEGMNVLYPIGWDAFGLPTENFAIKTKKQPAVVTRENIRNFTRQIKSYGPSFDWSREINTTDPEYYKWTQWIFLKLFNSFYDEKLDKARPITELEVPKGLNEAEQRAFIDSQRLAYEKEMPINWCPSCKIGLANEEVIAGSCERCGALAEKKNVRQWMLRITSYSERLIKDLNTVDYLEKIKTQQVNWIGKSEGAEVDFTVTAGRREEKLRVFTTRPDTIFGVSYMVVAPEHPLVESFRQNIRNWPEVSAYIEAAKNKSDIDRTDLTKEKTGVELQGLAAVNPVKGERIPIWISDYVLAGYGTGAIMAVPAHDTRDMEFAQKFHLPIRPVIKPTQGEAPEGAFVEDGISINSGEFSGLTTAQCKEAILAFITKNKLGTKAVNYKLRDWVFSRQHYWGEPIPIIKCAHCGNVPLKEKELPLTLPPVKNYEPTETGESPLASIKKWVEVACPVCGGPARRETDTMPNWAGSSWYFLRYIDPRNPKAFADRKKLDYWMPVDLYNGGMEHTTLHLLYSRFWHKFLFDLGYVRDAEPYAKRRSHGMIIAEDGQKMSKSRGNVVNPDEVIKNYGADTLRTYEMFMGPYGEAIAWSTNSLIGVHRFLERVWALQDKMTDSKKARRILAATSNPDKLRELKANLKGYDLVSLQDLKKRIPAPVEDGSTFQENSLLKAKYYARKTGLVTVADDSGLSIQAMDGQPGVYSSRFAGGDYPAAYEKIFAALQGKERAASFQAVITLYDPKKDSYEQFEGVCPGHIADAPQGEQGFGFDPIFIPDGLDKTFGECRWEEKARYDHRAQAAAKLKTYLAAQDDPAEIESLCHKTIKKVGEDIDELKFNTCVSQLMILSNALEKRDRITKQQLETLAVLLAPFAPHLAEEMWARLGNRKSVHLAKWPQFDPKLIQEKEIELVVQVNGKIRDKINVPADISEAEAKAVALGSDKVRRWFEGREPRKVFFVKGKLVSIVL